MLTLRWLTFSVVGLISLASVTLQSQPAIDKRVSALETSQAALVKRVTTLESLVKVQPTKPATILPTPTEEITSTESSHTIISIDAKITDSSSSFDKWSWIMVIQNNTGDTIEFMANIKFLDKDGFVVDQDYAFNLILKPHEKATFNGMKLVNASVSPDIASISAETQITARQ